MKIEDFLRQTVSMWAKVKNPAIVERFVLRNGKVYEPGPLPKGTRPGESKECFSNATLYAHTHGVRYVEGFGWREGLPILIHHAWVEVDGKAVDLTWRNPETCQYFGVAYSPEDMRAETLKNGYYGLFDNPATMINLPLMLKQDPGLRAEVEAITGTNLTPSDHGSRERIRRSSLGA